MNHPFFSDNFFLIPYSIAPVVGEITFTTMEMVLFLVEAKLKFHFGVNFVMMGIIFLNLLPCTWLSDNTKVIRG